MGELIVSNNGISVLEAGLRICMRIRIVGLELKDMVDVVLIKSSV